MQRALDPGILGEQVDGEREGVCRGLVTSQNDGDALVVKLLVGHAGGRFRSGLGRAVAGGCASLLRCVRIRVGGVEQHRKQVAAIGGVGAALGDHAVDQLVKVSLAAPEPLHGGNREALDLAGEREKGQGNKAHERVDR